MPGSTLPQPWALLQKLGFAVCDFKQNTWWGTVSELAPVSLQAAAAVGLLHYKQQSHFHYRVLERTGGELLDSKQNIVASFAAYLPPFVNRFEQMLLLGSMPPAS